MFHSIIYRDGYGLWYKVFESANEQNPEYKKLFSKGDLAEINYKIVCMIERKIYVEDIRK
jgi:hypothetical protein